MNLKFSLSLAALLGCLLVACQTEPVAPVQQVISPAARGRVAASSLANQLGYSINRDRAHLGRPPILINDGLVDVTTLGVDLFAGKMTHTDTIPYEGDYRIGEFPTWRWENEDQKKNAIWLQVDWNDMRPILAKHGVTYQWYSEIAFELKPGASGPGPLNDEQSRQVNEAIFTECKALGSAYEHIFLSHGPPLFMGAAVVTKPAHPHDHKYYRTFFLIFVITGSNTGYLPVAP